jgi:hypothetical protein
MEAQYQRLQKTEKATSFRRIAHAERRDRKSVPDSVRSGTVTDLLHLEASRGNSALERFFEEVPMRFTESAKETTANTHGYVSEFDNGLTGRSTADDAVPFGNGLMLVLLELDRLPTCLQMNSTKIRRLLHAHGCRRFQMGLRMEIPGRRRSYLSQDRR